MTRAETQFAFQGFFDRLACATVADETLAKAYVDALARYLTMLADDWQAVDVWSIQEYEQACEFVHHNAQWILNPSIAWDALAEANGLLAAHKRFLAESGLLPEALADRPRSSYGCLPTGEVSYVSPA